MNLARTVFCYTTGLGLRLRGCKYRYVRGAGRWYLSTESHRGPIKEGEHEQFKEGFMASKLTVIPITLREANNFVSSFHRHNGRTTRDGGKFAIGATTGEEMVGVAIVGNPLSATYMDGYTAEVLRTCTSPNAPKGTVSFLYSRCWRIWQAMGGRKLITYTLTTESGASLRGAGWKIVGQVKPHKRWQEKSNRDGKERQWQSIYDQPKLRWEIT